VLLRSKLHVTSEAKTRQSYALTDMVVTMFVIEIKFGSRKPELTGKIYGRFPRCPVRTESFRPDPESIHPESEVDSPDINYALCFSKGAFLTDCNQTRDVLCRSMDHF